MWKDILENPETSRHLGAEKISWKFNVPFAPWMGGYYERMIGLVKEAFKRTVGKQVLRRDDFTVLITEIKTVVNSRL